MATIGRSQLLAGGMAGLGSRALSRARLWAQDAKPGAFAQELILTPQQTEGPFSPVKLPLDTDNDLLIVNDSFTPEVGEVTHLSGRVLDAKGGRCATPWSRYGRSTTTAPMCTRSRATGTSGTRTSRASAAS